MSSMIMDVLGGRGYDVDNPVVSEIVATVEDRKFPEHTHKYLAALVITTLGLCKGEIALEKRKPPIEKWPKNVLKQLMEIAHIVTRHELES